MKFLIALLMVLSACLMPRTADGAPGAISPVCRRPAPGSEVAAPRDLRSVGGVLNVELQFRDFIEPDGQIGYCYLYKDGTEAPTLRLKPGDWLVLKLKNELSDSGAHESNSSMPGMSVAISSAKAACGNGNPASAASTNLHFHGLTVSPVCHQDDVLETAISPSPEGFQYKFQIPQNEPPGLYWYHPHIHGFTKAQVLGGASGALIVEGLERAEPDAAGLPERVLIIRDQYLVNPSAAPLDSDPSPPPAVVDPDGDARNTGVGTGKPAKDLSLNFVPVSYPAYKPAVIRTKPGQHEVWRVLNACAITYLNLQVVVGDQAQGVEVIAMDGVPLSENGLVGTGAVWENHIGLPPGGRAEFIVQTPATGGTATLLTRSVNTGPAGENDPVRPLATIVSASDAPAAAVIFPAESEPFPKPTQEWLGKVTPVRTRKLYFSERPSDPTNPNSPTLFYLTVDGEEPKLFDPNSPTPNIVAHEGDVEDWIIENRTQELHAFHIHQVHFLLLEWFGIPVNEPYLRDTINVPFGDGKTAPYPSVKLRMDFRDPNSVGTFIYHCHLLEHEDGGMMGIIRVEPRVQSGRTRPASLVASRKQISSTQRTVKKHIICGSAEALSARGF